jgi:hypothetical protein
MAKRGCELVNLLGRKESRQDRVYLQTKSSEPGIEKDAMAVRS